MAADGWGGRTLLLGHEGSEAFTASSLRCFPFPGAEAAAATSRGRKRTRGAGGTRAEPGTGAAAGESPAVRAAVGAQHIWGRAGLFPGCVSWVPSSFLKPCPRKAPSLRLPQNRAWAEPPCCPPHIAPGAPCSPQSSAAGTVLRAPGIGAGTTALWGTTCTPMCDCCVPAPWLGALCPQTPQSSPSPRRYHLRSPDGPSAALWSLCCCPCVVPLPPAQTPRLCWALLGSGAPRAPGFTSSVPAAPCEGPR